MLARARASLIKVTAPFWPSSLQSVARDADDGRSPPVCACKGSRPKSRRFWKRRVGGSEPAAYFRERKVKVADHHHARVGRRMNKFRDGSIKLSSLHKRADRSV